VWGWYPQALTLLKESSQAIFPMGSYAKLICHFPFYVFWGDTSYFFSGKGFGDRFFFFFSLQNLSMVVEGQMPWFLNTIKEIVG
jgi:hypothetical protein